MKIAIDARELRTSTGRYVERLLHYLQEIDKKNDYVVLLKPKDMDGWEPTNPRFVKLACPFKEFTFSEQLGFWLQLHKLKPDLVHFVMVQQPVLYQGKVVTTMQDLTTVRFRNPSKNWLVFTIKQQVYKLVTKWVAKKSAAIIVPTEFVKDDVARYTHTNSRKITVTLEAADRITDQPEPIEGLDDTQFITYVGRPAAHKNLRRLIEAYELLQKDHPELKLVLVGKRDSLYKALERQTIARGTEGVIFTDFVSEGQLRWLYEHAAAYVFPSLSEGFGLPALEAMVHGAPVVSSNATCLPEVYGEAAEYFDPLNIEEMAAAIAKVIDNPQRARSLVDKGHTQAGKYSWHRMSEETLAVYSDVLSS